MNLQHVVKINERMYEVHSRHGDVLILGKGKRFTVANMKTKYLLQRHCLTGRFMSVKIKGEEPMQPGETPTNQKPRIECEGCGKPTKDYYWIKEKSRCRECFDRIKKFMLRETKQDIEYKEALRRHYVKR